MNRSNRTIRRYNVRKIDDHAMSVLWGFFAIAVVVALWYFHLRARERAILAARAYCTQHGLQLLDESVALVRLRPSFDGPLRARRWYRFKVGDGDDVREAEVELLGQRVCAVRLLCAPT